MPTPREAYTNNVDRQGYSNARLRPADFASGAEQIGRAAEGFGQQLARAGDTLSEIQQRDAETAAQEADNIRTAKRLQRLYDGPEAYYNQEGRNALIDQEKVGKDLRKIDEETAQMLAHKPFARKLYDHQTLRRDNDELPRIFQHANRERTKYEDGVDADAFDLAIDNASSSEDPVIIEQSLVTAANISEKQARRKGFSDDNSVKQARQSGIGKAVEAVAQKLELTSPSEAQAFVVMHAKDMDPQDAGKLLASLAGNAAQERAGSDIAQYLVSDGVQPVEQPTEAADEAPAGATAIPPDEALDAAQWAQESGGKHRDAQGRLTTSSAGAQGISQVMPATGPNPGYGVKPLQNSSREEYIRFGKDYRAAMLKHFNGNIVLALTAYNWGPGNVEEHIKQVGDPSKGEISDAAFLASIPNKEAQDYAAEILNNVGVKVAGKPGKVGPPVKVGAEINLEATINNIRSSDRPFVEKQALIAEATRMHGYGKQVKAEAEAAIVEETYKEINELPPGDFVDYNKLPLTLRQKLDANPQLAVRFKNEAATNKTAKDNASVAASRQQAMLDLTNMRYGSPADFLKLDINALPNLTTVDKQQALGWQEAERKSLESGGAARGANHDAMRTMINRFTDAKNKPENVGAAYTVAIQKEEAWLAAHPNTPMTDTVREGIAREVMTKYTVMHKGGFFGGETTGATVRGYELPAEKARLGDKYSRVTVDSFEAVKAQLEQVWGRIPTDAEVQAEIGKRTTGKGLRL